MNWLGYVVSQNYSTPVRFEYVKRCQSHVVQKSDWLQSKVSIRSDTSQAHVVKAVNRYGGTGQMSVHRWYHLMYLSLLSALTPDTVAPDTSHMSLTRARWVTGLLKIHCSFSRDAHQSSEGWLSRVQLSGHHCHRDCTRHFIYSAIYFLPLPAA